MLIVSNLKMINKCWPFPPRKNFCGCPWMIVLSRFRFFATFVLSRIMNCLFLSVLLISVSKSTELTRFFLLFHQNYLQQQMLYTNYCGCCRLFQTTIKNCKVPHLKCTEVNCIQVTTLTYCNIQVKQHDCTMLATATGNCDVTNVTNNANKYYVVTWTVYLDSSMYLRRRQWLRQIVVMCHIACWFRTGAV